MPRAINGWPVADDPVRRMVREERGTASKIARALNISRPAVWRWQRVPAEYVLIVEQVTGIPRHRIRPDIYPKNLNRAARTAHG